MKTILIVDDEIDILDAVETLLEMEGYRVIKAANGQEALRILSEKRPDLVLSDVMMPVLTGIELLNALRNDPRYKSLPFIFMSAAPPDRFSEVTQQQRRLFLKKPLDVDHLLETVSEVLRTESA